MKRRHKIFLSFLAIGLVLMVLDELWKMRNKKNLDYVDVRVRTDGNYISGSIRGRDKEKVKELIEKLAENGKVVWFGAPQLSDCPLELWDAWEERFYRVCRGKDDKWYVQLPGSYQGRSAERYFETEEGKAGTVITKIKQLLSE